MWPRTRAHTLKSGLSDRISNASSLRLEGGLTAVVRHLGSDRSGRTRSEQTEVKTRGHG